MAPTNTSTQMNTQMSTQMQLWKNMLYSKSEYFINGLPFVTVEFGELIEENIPVVYINGHFEISERYAGGTVIEMYEGEGIRPDGSIIHITSASAPIHLNIPIYEENGSYIFKLDGYIVQPWTGIKSVGQVSIEPNHNKQFTESIIGDELFANVMIDDLIYLDVPVFYTGVGHDAFKISEDLIGGEILSISTKDGETLSIGTEKIIGYPDIDFGVFRLPKAKISVMRNGNISIEK